jgi:acetyl-CoA carboxylase biotin carboxyl carrier protein
MWVSDCDNATAARTDDRYRFDMHTIVAELVGNVSVVSVSEGDAVEATDTLVILESMKMEIPVLAEVSGVVHEVAVNPGDVIREGDVIAVIEES